MIQKQYKPIRDKFAKARGRSVFLSICCSKCEAEILLYQKDGPGPLKRMYLDRIRAPEKLNQKVMTYTNKAHMETLFCPSCKGTLALPIVYEKEDRLAYSVAVGAIKKKRTKGIFPTTETETIP